MRPGAGPRPESGGDAPLVVARDLRKEFPLAGGRVVHALSGVSLTIGAGETLGVVGESGSGKSTLGRCLLRLIEPSGGGVWFAGRDLVRLPGAELRRVRREMQIVFQDTSGSLNPRLRVGAIVAEGLDIHHLATGPARARRIGELLGEVGLDPGAAERYPHELSGGQRQRVGIARALAVGPRFVVLDEPVSALDVSVRAHVLNLLRRLQARLGLTYLLVSHDLRVVEHMSDRILVMYLGRIVEAAPRATLFGHASHPYTRALLAAAPTLDPRRRPEPPLGGEVPSALRPPAGCAFHARCPFVEPRCRVERPPLVAGADGHAVACHVFTPAPESSTEETCVAPGSDPTPGP